jgi:hypothetical protein
VESILLSGGGKKNGYLSEMITHVISDDCDDGEVSVAKELYQLPVVTVTLLSYVSYVDIIYGLDIL